jgi:preprotein translocase subunit SecA
LSVPLERLSALIPPEPPRPEGLAALIWKAERLVDPRRLLALTLGPLSRHIHARALQLGGLAEPELDCRLAAARAGIRRAGRVTLSSMPEALALLAEVAARTTGMRPYPVQLRGAMAVQRGFLIEMQTGEGKSLTAALAAALAAWTGRPCHVLTANVYLADRDASSFTAFYQACGLSVAAVRDTDPPPARSAAYGADVVYTTAKEMLADLLRDAISMGPTPARARLGLKMLGGMNETGPTLRGLGTAIVDEADSLLIDDAVTPLIIAQERHVQGFDAAMRVAVEISAGFEPGPELRLEQGLRRAELTDAGQARLARELSRFSSPWSEPARASHLVGQALTARFMLQRGRHYVLDEGKITLLDEQTGRRAIGRSLSDGLHQALELVEGVEPSALTEVIGRRSFQRFFRLFPNLAGLTGTAAEAAGEFWSIYGLHVLRIPTHRPPRRRVLQTRLLADEALKFAAIGREAFEFAQQGRPVLIGTRSVDGAEALALLLRGRGLTPRILTALDASEEVEVIATAGNAGAVTVATNMAGRGTDIGLDPEIAAIGGLHVIIAEANDLRRIDRQMAGRAARQGDPGSVRCFLAPTDVVFRRALSQRGQRVLAWAAGRPAWLGGSLGKLALWRAQRQAARLGTAMRRNVLTSDLQFEGVGLS